VKGLRTWILPLLALLGAGGLAMLRSDSVTHSRLPLAENRGPHGSAVLATYLREAGRPVDTVVEGLPASTDGSWLLAAPQARIVSEEEVARLRDFVVRGGTLVYLSGAPKAQPHLSAWLGLAEGPMMQAPTRALNLDDPGGVSLALVSRGEGALHLAAGRSVVAEAATPIAAAADAVGLWRREEGLGAVWIAAGPSLIQNARLALGDNLAFWVALSEQGPLTWIETFHVPAEPPSSRALLAFALQLALCIAVGALCFGPRLGPPRPIPELTHRSSLESVRALGWLLRRSRVEPGLVGALRERLDVVAASLPGVPRGLSAGPLSVLLEQRAGLPAEATRALLLDLEAHARARSVRPGDFAALARRAAVLERALQGAATPGQAPFGDRPSSRPGHMS